MKKILYILGLTTQLALIIGVFYTESLTKKKAGVMHHVYYRKVQYEQTIFSESNMNIHRIVIAGAIAISIVFLLKALKKNSSKFHMVQSLAGLLLSVSTLFITYQFSDKIAYYYFIMAFEAATAIQMIVLFFLIRNRKNI